MQEELLHIFPPHLRETLQKVTMKRKYLRGNPYQDRTACDLSYGK